MKIYLSTLGCKLNESELEAWARRFAHDGYEIVNDASAADLIVLNTCTVTHVAARKTRQLARQLARANPNARLVLTGCFVSISPGEAQALPNVALVVPNASKDQLVEQIANGEWHIANGAEMQQPTAIRHTLYAISQQWLDADVETQAAGRKPEVASFKPPATAVGGQSLSVIHPRTRAFVKIQDGCNMSCAYCIIPHARGEERSRPRNEIVDEVKSLVSAGYKEIILTGVQISAYSNLAKIPDLRKDSLRDLVTAILAETNAPRLRLTSIAPWNVDETLLNLWCDRRLCRHLHLSLQSGSDTVLRRMRRPYTTAQFARAVEIARAKIPDVGVTTDIIVGFPGESDAEFEQSLRFVEQMRFSRAHVFMYSKRDGTSAAALPMQVSDAVKESRARQMQAVADAGLRAFARRFIGREVTVLWETRETTAADGWQTADNLRRLAVGGLWSGYSDNYIRVVAASDANLCNQFTSAQVTSVKDDCAIAVL